MSDVMEETPPTDPTPLVDHNSDATDTPPVVTEPQALDLRAHTDDDDAAAREAGASNVVAFQTRDSVENSEPPIHHAWCMKPECGAKVTFRRTASGTGIIVLERVGVSVEANFGIGPNGRPTCPRDHGEMTMADEQLPAADAITQVATKVNGEAKQLRLPGTVAPFDVGAAFKHIVEKRHKVKRLSREHDELAERKKKKREALDEAIGQLAVLIDNYEERKAERDLEIARAEERAAAGHPEDTNLVRCSWEQMNPGKTCSVCVDPWLKTQPRFGTPDSEQHAVEVRNYGREKAVDLLGKALHAIGFVISPQVIAEFSTDDFNLVDAWAGHALVNLDDRDAWINNLPAALGRPHVLGETASDATVVCCKTCGSVLFTQQLNLDVPIYPAGTRVGIDCVGEPVEIEPARQIPARHKGKKVDKPKIDKSKDRPKGKGRKK